MVSGRLSETGKDVLAANCILCPFRVNEVPSTLLSDQARGSDFAGDEVAKPKLLNAFGDLFKVTTCSLAMTMTQIRRFRNTH